jgi:hypothetical protein
MAAAKPWWQDRITQAFNPPTEPGEDIGTPYGTDVTALQGGIVTSAAYGPYGGRVDINVGGQTEIYYQHLDYIEPWITPGAHVSAADLLGTSGGQLSGGMHPNNPANSTGPHIEVGETIAGRPVNPSQIIAAGPAGVGSSAPTANVSWWTRLSNVWSQLVAAPGAVTSNLPSPASPFQSAGSAIQGAIIPLVIAAIIIVLVLGVNDKSSPPPSPPQIVPVPV